MLTGNLLPYALISPGWLDAWSKISCFEAEVEKLEDVGAEEERTKCFTLETVPVTLIQSGVADRCATQGKVWMPRAYTVCVREMPHNKHVAKRENSNGNSSLDHFRHWYFFKKQLL